VALVFATPLSGLCRLRFITLIATSPAGKISVVGRLPKRIKTKNLCKKAI